MRWRRARLEESPVEVLGRVLARALSRLSLRLRPLRLIRSVARKLLLLGILLLSRRLRRRLTTERSAAERVLLLLVLRSVLALHRARGELLLHPVAAVGLLLLVLLLERAVVRGNLLVGLLLAVSAEVTKSLVHACRRRRREGLTPGSRRRGSKEPCRGTAAAAAGAPAVPGPAGAVQAEAGACREPACGKPRW